jgi:hypothetical protein
MKARPGTLRELDSRRQVFDLTRHTPRIGFTHGWSGKSIRRRSRHSDLGRTSACRLAERAATGPTQRRALPASNNYPYHLRGGPCDTRRGFSRAGHGQELPSAAKPDVGLHDVAGDRTPGLTAARLSGVDGGVRGEAGRLSGLRVLGRAAGSRGTFIPGASGVLTAAWPAAGASISRRANCRLAQRRSRHDSPSGDRQVIKRPQIERFHAGRCGS